MAHKVQKKRNPLNGVGVDFGDDHIAIFDKDGEIVYWDRSEWEIDPEVVFSIANAIWLASTEGGKYLRRAIGK
jgi:hypothetical protein